MRCPACSGGTPVGGPDVTPHPSTTVPAPSNLDHEGRICITSLRRASHRALSAEGLGVERVDALPPETIAQVIREGLLHQPVFAVDVGDHRRLFQRAGDRADRVDRAVEIEIAGTLLHAAPAANGRRVNLAIVPSAPPRRLPASSRGLRACDAPARGLLVLSGSASQRAPRDRCRRNLEWRLRGGIARRGASRPSSRCTIDSGLETFREGRHPAPNAAWKYARASAQAGTVSVRGCRSRPRWFRWLG